MVLHPMILSHILMLHMELIKIIPYFLVKLISSPLLLILTHPQLYYCQSPGPLARSWTTMFISWPPPVPHRRHPERPGRCGTGVSEWLVKTGRAIRRHINQYISLRLILIIKCLDLYRAVRQINISRARDRAGVIY